MNTDRFRSALIDARESAERSRKFVTDESDQLDRGAGDGELSNADQHLGDDGAELQERELDAGLEENAESVIAAIDHALARIDDGTYGTCERCGKSIPEARLEARPWAVLCIEDQEKEDHGA